MELKKNREELNKIYFRCFAANAVKVDNISLKKTIIYGIKYINTYDLNSSTSYFEFYHLFQLICLLKDKMRQVTYQFFLTNYPIIKEFNGAKWESKDYFSTMDYLKDIDLNSIVNDDLDNFLWNYYNQELMTFSLKEFLIIDKMRKMRGARGIMEEFMDMIGVDSYIINKKEGYIINKRTGEKSIIKEPDPRTSRLL